MSLRRSVQDLGARCLIGLSLIGLSLGVLPYGFPALAQTPQTARQISGYISGTVIDRAGAVAVGAHVELTREDQSRGKEVLSGENGQFSFADTPPGPFQLTILAPGFQIQKFSGDLRPGEAYIVPAISLPVATLVTEVRVGLTQQEVATIQLKEEEKQRVLGFIPNFYVSYIPDAAPLSSKQKYHLARKSVLDPFTFVGVGVLAGTQQASDDFGGYGQGVQGYTK